MAITRVMKIGNGVRFLVELLRVWAVKLRSNRIGRCARAAVT